MRKLWLIGSGLMALVASAEPVRSAEVLPGGALDIILSGSLRSGIAFAPDDPVAEGPDDGYGFITDNRFEIDVVGKDDATGTEYGGYIRLRLDNGRGSSNNLVDRGYLYFKGDFGEVQIGSQQGITDDDFEFSPGSYLISAGTGGLSGDQPGQIVRYLVASSGNGPKLIYRIPEVAGVTAGVSFSPDTGANGLISSIDDSNGDNKEVVEAAVRYDHSFGPLDLSLAVAGTAGKTEDTDNDVNGISFGGTFGYSDLAIAGAYGTGEEDEDDLEFWNIGIGGTYGPLGLSAEYGWSSEGDDEADTIVISSTFKFMPGVSLRADLQYNDPDYAEDYVAGLGEIRIDF